MRAVHVTAALLLATTTSLLGTAAAASGTAASFTTVAAGQGFLLGLTPDGHVYTWGGNELGQLGQGDTRYRATPTLVPGLSGVQQVAAGGYHALAVTTSGAVYAWGYNDFAQVEPTATQVVTRPHLVSGVTAASVAAGGDTSYAVTSTGAVRQWGQRCTHAEESGDAGVSSFSCDNSAVRRPVTVSGLPAIATLVAGNGNAFAVTTSGDLYAWGENADSRLGLGRYTYVTQPTKVSGISDVAQIASAPQQTVARTGSGAVYAWGNDFQGRLAGTGEHAYPDGYHDLTTPTPIPALSGIVDVAAGDSEVLAVDGSGTVHAWGWGVGTAPAGSERLTGDPFVPTAYPQLGTVQHVEASAGLSAALLSDGTTELLMSKYWDQFPLRSAGHPSSPVAAFTASTARWAHNGGGYSLYLSLHWGWTADPAIPFRSSVVVRTDNGTKVSSSSDIEPETAQGSSVSVGLESYSTRCGYLHRHQVRWLTASLTWPGHLPVVKRITPAKRACR